VLLVVSLTAYAKHTTEELAKAETNTRLLKGAVDTLTAESARKDELLITVQSERDELIKRGTRTKTVFREVLINDPEAAECGNAPMPESVASLVREYAGSGATNNAATEPASTDTGT